MARDLILGNVKGKMKLIFEEKKGGGKTLVDIELDETAKIEITSFIDGFNAGKNSVLHGIMYAGAESLIADKIIYRYIDLDTTTDRLQVYRLICQKIEEYWKG